MIHSGIGEFVGKYGNSALVGTAPIPLRARACFTCFMETAAPLSLDLDSTSRKFGRYTRVAEQKRVVPTI